MNILIAAHKERATGQEVRALSVQLSADLQVIVSAHRLPPAQLQADHQPGPEPRHTPRALSARPLSCHLHPLS